MLYSAESAGVDVGTGCGCVDSAAGRRRGSGWEKMTARKSEIDLFPLLPSAGTHADDDSR